MASRSGSTSTRIDRVLDELLDRNGAGGPAQDALPGLEVGRDAWGSSLALAALAGPVGGLVLGALWRSLAGPSPADDVLRHGRDDVLVVAFQHVDPLIAASPAAAIVGQRQSVDGVLELGEVERPGVEDLAGSFRPEDWAATFALVRSWAAQRPQVIAGLVGEGVDRFRVKLVRGGRSVELAAAISEIVAGWSLVLRCLSDLGLLTDTERREWWDEIVRPLISDGQLRRHGISESPPPPVAPVRGAGSWRAPAAVLDEAGRVHFGDGEIIDLPELPTHLGEVAELVDRLQLGWGDRSRRVPDVGQVWLTRGLLVRLGLPEEAPETVEDLAGVEAVAGAVEAGWQFGQRPHGFWRIWRGRASAMLGMWPWMTGLPLHARDGRRPEVVDELAPVELLGRLDRLAELLGVSWRVDYVAMGQDTLRAWAPARVPWVLETEVEPARDGNAEGDYYWSRRMFEGEGSWVHCYDRGGSYLAGMSSVWLGVGEPEYTRGSGAWDGGREVPGYWLIERPTWERWDRPSPLDGCSRRRRDDETLWVTTPTVRRLMAEGVDVRVLESWSWSERSRVLRPAYEALRDARASVLDDATAPGTALRETIKGVYSRGVGSLARARSGPGERGWRPDWRHHVIAQTRAAIDHGIVAMAERSGGRTPVAIGNDALWIASDDPDPVTAWPGDPAKLGRALGSFRPEGSLPAETFKEFLGKDRFPARAALEAIRREPAVAEPDGDDEEEREDG